MTQWTEVHGAKMAKTFVDENVREAKDYNWTEIESSRLTDHVHCIICLTAIPADPLRQERFFQSAGVFLCAHCYESYVRTANDD